MADAPSPSIVIPTRARPVYLDVALESVMAQARQVGAEVVVVSDGPDEATDRVTLGHGARLLTLPEPRGANAARNAGIGATSGDPVIFLDDDVCVSPGWLATLLAGMRTAPEYDVFGGPMHARLEGGGPRACGRESPPITTLELGPQDRDAALVWAANMAVRRAALSRVGLFDESIHGRGEEEDWELRYKSAGGRIRYIAAAGVEHRRTQADSTIASLAHAGYGLGRTARRYDVRKGDAPALRTEMRTVAGCAWHTVRRRCANGIVMGAHAAGRLREALSEGRSA